MSNGRLSRLADALDDRLGWRNLAAAAADEAVRGGARYAYVFGSALLFTFVLQVVTGIAMASAYSPSVTDAWGSVYYIQHVMTLGWLVRGLHHFGSSAMIILCVLHMTQVFLHGAHRAPREANWITGVIMLLLVLGFGLTGYLLPWDQKGYWATQVATSIIGGTPGGPALQAVLQGGSEYGNLTLTRFYALHVFVLPVTLTLLITGHVYLFRRHGVTPSPTLDDAALSRVETFWPYQVLKDLVFAGVVLGCLVALAVLVGADLEAPADPAGGYEARPEWYFLFLFQLLKYFEGPLVMVGTVVIPTLAVGFLFLVPFLDRLAGSDRARPSLKVALPMLAIFVGAGGLTAVALSSDAASESFKEGRAKAVQQAERAVELAALGGIDARGRVVLLEGERLFHDKGCASCHVPGTDDYVGPVLEGFGTPARIDAFLVDPNGDEFFGGNVLADEMDPFEGDDAKRAALVAWLSSLAGIERHPAPSAAQLEQGRGVFESGGCLDCHNDPALTPRDDGWDHAAAGPDLAGYQSFEWTRGLIRNASHPAYFGGTLSEEMLDDAMPRFEDLTADELHLLVTWLLAGAPGAR